MDEIIRYFSTGYAGIDYLLGGGFQPGTVNAIASRPGMGKSALAQNIAMNMWTNGCRAMYLSLESTSEFLVERFAKMAHSRYGETKELPFTDEAVGFYAAAPTVTNAGDIMGLIRKGCWDAEQDVIFIDYIQLMEETENLMGIKVLKNIALDTALTFVLCSQVDRRIEERKDKRPRPYDMRCQSEYISYLDTALMLYRDRYYNPDGSETDSEISVWKNNGTQIQRAGTVQFKFYGGTYTFMEAN